MTPKERLSAHNKPLAVAILQEIKVILKKKGMTYASLAQSLKLSQATMKRIFSGSDVGMGRCLEICDVLGVEFLSIVEMATKKKENKFSLSVKQEQFLADHEVHFAIFQALNTKGVGLEEIVEKSGLCHRQLVPYLADLERLRLLDRYPKNRIQLTVNGSHSWLDGGPLFKTYSLERSIQWLQKTMMLSTGDKQVVQSSLRTLHSGHYESLIHDIRELSKKYRQQSYFDEKFYESSEVVNVQWLFGASIVEPHWIGVLQEVAKKK